MKITTRRVPKTKTIMYSDASKQSLLNVLFNISMILFVFPFIAIFIHIRSYITMKPCHLERDESK